MHFAYHACKIRRSACTVHRHVLRKQTINNEIRIYYLADCKIRPYAETILKFAFYIGNMQKYV
jgi:hypothetical protein